MCDDSNVAEESCSHNVVDGEGHDAMRYKRTKGSAAEVC